MSPMTAAEKQKAYRQRKEAAIIAQNHFGGKTEMTYPEFLGVAEFNLNDFLFCLKGLGRESDKYIEERDDIYKEAFDETFKEEYAELLRDQGDDFDPEDDDDIREEAEERARDAAGERLEEWQASITDYRESCIVYSLGDLIAAYREACGL
jgi:hypothetical protein